ncbi:MAG: recombinase family protein [Planctomycetes bacterium]|nr:recombinase family protein [Planctomycetota bacterium]
MGAAVLRTVEGFSLPAFATSITARLGDRLYVKTQQETRRERQAAGIAAAKERGVYRGRRSGTYKAVPTRAGELRAKGPTTTDIAQALGVSRATVIRCLHACA